MASWVQGTFSAEGYNASITMIPAETAPLNGIANPTSCISVP